MRLRLFKMGYYIQAQNAPRSVSSVTAHVMPRLMSTEGAAPFFVDVAVALALVAVGPVGTCCFVVEVARALAAVGTFVAGNRVVVFPLMTTAVA